MRQSLLGSQSLQKALEEKLETGEVCSARTLKAYLWQRGWRASVKPSDVDTNGCWVNVYSGAHSRIKLRCSFPVEDTRLIQPRIWIYATLARSGDKTACYIGQAKFILRRLYQHRNGLRDGRGSAPLWEWISKERSTPYALLLEYSPGAGSRSATGQSATRLEGKWVAAAKAAGVHLPGEENWAQLPTGLHGERQWDEAVIRQWEISLDELLRRPVPLREFCLLPPRHF